MADGEITVAIGDYHEFFMNASPRTIMEVLVNIYKQDLIENGKKSIWGKNPSEYLVEKIDLDLGKLDSISSTESSLHKRINSSYFGIASEPLHKCLKESSCGDLHKITKSLGKIQLVKTNKILTILDTPFIQTITNHPVHIVDEKNNYLPSAFIPFCSFAGNLSVMGARVSKFDLPVCDKFRPVIIEGQLCYQVDVNQFMNQIDRKKLMSHGLVFMMDYNNNRMGPHINSEWDKDMIYDVLDEEQNKNSKDEALIFIETIGKYMKLISLSIYNIYKKIL